MNTVNYLFSSLAGSEGGMYLLATVKDRELTKIYHSHDFFELVYIMEGTCVHQINDTLYTMQTGDFVFLRPGDIHCFTSQSKNLHLLGLSIEASEFLRFQNAYGADFREKLSDRIMIINYGKPFSLLRQWLGTENIKADRRYESKLILTYFINRFLEYNLEMSSEYDLDKFSLALKEMKKEPNLRIGLPAFIELSHYSHTQLARLTKHHLGMSPHDYVKELRLATAYDLILYTQDKTEDIAERVGYHSTSHFIQVFKERYGVSPAELRRQGKAETV